MLAVGGLLGLRRHAVASEAQTPALQLTNTLAPPGQLALPTATPTVAGGAAAAPSRTPTFPVVLLEAVQEANVRNGPGLDFDIVGTLTAGNPVQVIGRSINFPWYVIEWPGAENDVAWVFEDLVTVQGDITTIPIYPDPSAPTIDPTLAAVQATATVLLQTPGAAETATATALFAPTGVFTSTPDAGAVPAEGAGPLPEFTAQPAGPANGLLPGQQIPAGGGIPPAMVILTLGGLGVLALIVSVLRR